MNYTIADKLAAALRELANATNIGQPVDIKWLAAAHTAARDVLRDHDAHRARFTDDGRLLAALAEPMDDAQAAAAAGHAIRPPSDPLTIAYIAKGATCALLRLNVPTRGPELDRITDSEGGEMNLVSAAIAYAPEADAAVEKAGDAWAGVFAYDVCEEFGEWFISTWVADGREPETAAAVAKLRALVAEQTITSSGGAAHE